MKSLTTDAARKAVFNTNELLEQIILCLPMRTIFGIQRVSRNFKDVIATSPKIQEKMFLRLRKDIPAETWMFETLNRDPDNPNRAVWKKERDVRFEKIDPNSVKTKGRLLKPVVLNPLLHLTSWITPVLPAKTRLYLLLDKRESVAMNFSPSHFGSHHSFLKTYITDPPCYTANAVIEADVLLDPTKEPIHGRAIAWGDTSDQGLTIGDVVLARTDVYLHWGRRGHPDEKYTDTQLEKVIRDRAPFVMGKDSKPNLTLELFGVVIPTDEEWRAASSEHEEVTS